MKNQLSIPKGTKRNFFIGALVLIALLLIGNSVMTRNQNLTSAPTPSPSSPISVPTIENALLGSYKFEKGLDATQPFVPVSGKSYSKENELIHIYEFSSENEAEQTKEEIGTDGYAVGTTIYEWVEPPHFYQKGNVIILYFGSNPDVLAYLRESVGEPFVDRL